MNQSPSPRSFKPRKLIAPVVVLLIAVAIYIALVKTTPSLNTTAKDPVPVAVKALTIAPATMDLTVSSEGNVQPRAETKLVAQVAGEVTTIGANLLSGAAFNEGDELLTIDPRDYEIAIDRAQANLERSKAELDFAENEAARIQSLYAKELASVTEVQQVKRLLAIATAGFMDAQASLERANVDLERTVIKAPFSGRVRTESADVGQFLQKGTHVATVYATDRLEVRLPLADSQLAYLHPSYANTGVAGENPASVRLSANYAGGRQTWDALLTRTEGDISTKSRFLHVIAEVTETVNDNGVRLPVGLFVEANIQGRSVNDLVSIPRTALRADNTVMVIDDNNLLHFRDVEVFKLSAEDVLVSGGLSAGERINTSPLQFVVEGMPVRVVD